MRHFHFSLRITGTRFTLQSETSEKQKQKNMKQWYVRHWTSDKERQWSLGESKQTRRALCLYQLTAWRLYPDYRSGGETSQNLMDSLSRDGVDSPRRWGQDRVPTKRKPHWENSGDQQQLPNIEPSTAQWVCVRKSLWPRKEPPKKSLKEPSQKILERIVFSAHTG